MAAKKRFSETRPKSAGRDRDEPGDETALANRPFQVLAELKAALKPKETVRAATPRPRTPLEKAAAPPKAGQDEAGELELFRRAMTGTVPFKHKNKIRAKEPPDPAVFKEPPKIDEDLEALKALTALVDDGAEFDLFYTDEYLEGRLKKLAPEIMEDLRLGKFAYQDHLDLHGYTVAQAEEAVAEFILNAINKRYGCVLLVHGRGRRSQDGVGILKRNLETFLLNPRVRRHVLAFTTARAIDGGTGASYVLLKI